METKIVVSRDRYEHEKNMDAIFEEVGKIDKLMIFHKIVKAQKNGFTFLTFIHFERVK